MIQVSNSKTISRSISVKQNFTVFKKKLPIACLCSGEFTKICDILKMRAGGEAGGHPPLLRVSRPLAVTSEASRGRERELERRAAQLQAENAELVLSAQREQEALEEVDAQT